MPIFMDRHEVDEEVTPEQVSQIHQQDLKIQDQFNCRVISYFFDPKRNNVFCLIEAPDEESMTALHEHSHGQVANKVIEVDEHLLSSFLGEIERPRKEGPDDLYINRASATRIIMLINIIRNTWDPASSKFINKPLQEFNHSMIQIIESSNGSIVEQEQNRFLISFKSALDAVSCSLDLQMKFGSLKDKHNTTDIQLKIGISTGPPLSDGEHLFESTIKFAERMCLAVKGQIIVSFDVENQYKSEILDAFDKNKALFTLNPSDEDFINHLMEYIENKWSDADLNVEDLSKHLGYSNSQLYRKMKVLTGNSPNSVIREYRLHKALIAFDEQRGNISEVAYQSGFNSPAYFAKCFHNKYGILPSDYMKQVAGPRSEG